MAQLSKAKGKAKTPYSGKLKIKKGDRVVVIAGRDKGKQGEVLRVLPKEKRVVVQNVQIVKRHQKPSAQSGGGIVEKESSIDVSNVAHLDPADNKPVRIGIKIENGQKLRYAKRSGTVIDG